jgi:membrane protein DedA with SNARE-associated domain
MIRRLFLSLQTRMFLASHLPLAGLISLETLRNALNTLGYPAVAIFIMIESSGIPFPGETMLLLASFYAAVDQKLQLPVVIACAALGAIVGDNIGYTVGRTGGHTFFNRFGRYLFLKPEHLKHAERFFLKHGNKTVFFGRFIAVLRAWSAFLAGVNHMRWSAFLFYNATGGIIWAIFYGCLGFYAGKIFHDNFGMVEYIARISGWVGTAVIILAIVVAYFIWRRRKRRPQTEPSSPATESGPEEPEVVSSAEHI